MSTEDSIKAIYGNCKTEQDFKMLWIKQNRKKFLKVFCIETEETVKGFPDVLIVAEAPVFDETCNEKARVQTPVFIEFKFTKNGLIKFQPTQPAFYRANSQLNIQVCALCLYKGKFSVHRFFASELFRENSLFKLDCMNRVDLRPLCTGVVNESTDYKS